MKCKHEINEKQCQAFAVSGSEYCFSHDPKLKDQKKLAVVKGGKVSKRGPEVRLASVQIEDKRDVITFLTCVIDELRTGKLEVKRANSLGYLGGVLIKAFELAEMEERLEKVEKLVLEKRTYRN